MPRSNDPKRSGSPQPSQSRSLASGAGSSSERPSAPSTQQSPGGDGPIISEAEVHYLIETNEEVKPEVIAELVRKAEELGQRLASKELNLKTSQIRNVFGAVRRIQMAWSEEPDISERRGRAPHELLLLRPKLAYQVARHKRESRGIVELERILRPAIDAVGNDRRRFQRFVDFFEAIIAYHRYYGGSDS